MLLGLAPCYCEAIKQLEGSQTKRVERLLVCGNNMAGVRKAMLEMGLATCCILCDSPDDPGTSRCRSCINSHKEMREKIAKLPSESLAGQWAKELLQMLARPSSYEHDENHGE